jgi:putative intracellular protease/amidase
MMHDASLSAKKFAIMVAHGFAEEGFIAVQRAMMQATAQLKVIAPHGGLANGRSESGIGMSYPVDAQLSETLAIDYDGLVIPAGQMHLDKLADEPHAARIIRAFQREDMPILAIGAAAGLLENSAADGQQIAQPESGAVRVGQLVIAANEKAIAEAMRLLAEAATGSDGQGVAA